MQISNDLIKACMNQERKAQKQLYDLLLPYLRAVADRYLRDSSFCKDALQESFIKIFKSIAQYNPQIAPFHQWAVKIVVNTCFNFNQRIITKTHEELNPIQHDIPIAPETIKDLSDEYLLWILKQMPNDFFEVFNLFVIDEYSHEEIAEILNINEALSRKRLSRAKQWLKENLTISALGEKFVLKPKSFLSNPT